MEDTAKRAKRIVDDANLAMQRGLYPRALQQYRQALTLIPNHPGILNNSAAALEKLDRLDEALATYERAQAQLPPHAGILINCGVVLMKLRRLDEALSRIDRAILLNPQYAEAFNNRGNILFRLQRVEEALDSYDDARKLRPGHVATLLNRAFALQALKRYREAGVAFEEILRRDPSVADAQQLLLNNRLLCCDWTDYATTRLKQFIHRVHNGEKLVDPFYFLSIADRAASQLIGAQTVGAQYSSKVPDVRITERMEGRIHVAYLCAEFGEHHTMWYLTEGLFKRHDRTRFKITGVSIGPKQAETGPYFDDWIDGSRKNDADLALLLRQRRVDIAVDLNGFSGTSRPGIFAHRVAPVQVNWLAFPGTMGMGCMDYLIADHHVIPTGFEKYYTESVIRLPDTYQANNHREHPVEQPASRADNGLPEGAFVFCCFNNNYKIRPDVFDVWMRLLKGIDGSVFWLLGDNADAMSNLRSEAEKRGVTGSRLIFAGRVGGAAHLARQGCADLFLDTFPYGAHVTATDALWAGLPVLTRSGETFASRVAGSLLKAVDLPELVTESFAEYEEKARRLAIEPSTLRRLKEKLQANQSTCALFDVDRFRNQIEKAFVIAHERHQRGLRPANFDV
jgi:predicted O-linked N-acetylglucosamine transferase (SPINDLY family)